MLPFTEAKRRKANFHLHVASHVRAGEGAQVDLEHTRANFNDSANLNLPNVGQDDLTNNTIFRCYCLKTNSRRRPAVKSFCIQKILRAFCSRDEGEVEANKYS